MPTQSREILTLRLVVDCQLDLVQDDPNPSVKLEGREDAFTKIPTGPSNCRSDPELDLQTESAPLNDGLLALPIEVRLKILRYVLLFENNIQKHTRRLPSESIKHLLSLDSRRILEAPQFKHKGKQEINGVLPIYMSCNIDPSVLRVCRTLCLEGSHVLYRSNLVVAIQCGIKGLGAKFRNYGIRVWGPLQPSRITGPGEPPLATSEISPDDVLKPACFNPVVTFRGKSSKADTPFYICSNRSLTYLVHALWILIKCPFARGMKFTVHTNPQGRQRHRRIVHGFLKFQLLPWMHNHVEKITGPGPANEDIEASKWLQHHRKSSLAAPNVYTYNAVCAYLEQLLAGAEKDIEAGSYTSAETLHELVCYQACSIVRTRTGKLVDVSTKTNEGINRVCKLIAISAFRLCELRSGAVMDFRAFGTVASSNGEQKKEPLQSNIDSPATCCPFPEPRPTSEKVKTTRLEHEEAVDHAILSALLALRLPCATPVPEWNIRLNQMLLYLFNIKNDRDNAKSCIRHLHAACAALMKDAQARNKTGGKWVDLEALMRELKENMVKDVKGTNKRQEVYQKLVEQTQDVARKLWGERLTPKKGYIGLIWTFRWA